MSGLGVRVSPDATFFDRRPRACRPFHGVSTYISSRKGGGLFLMEKHQKSPKTLLTVDAWVAAPILWGKYPPSQIGPEIDLNASEKGAKR